MHTEANAVRYGSRRNTFFSKMSCVSLALLGLTACGGAAYDVRTGVDPRYEDDHVAFRTTYYFRVFDYCANQARLRTDKSGGADAQTYKGVPVIDSLYRFRMTGKASTLANRIHFESGTLMAWELDPFGSNVIYDDKLGRFRFQSRQEMESEARKAKAMRDYEDLLKRYQNMSAQQKDSKNAVALYAGETLTEALQSTARHNTNLPQAGDYVTGKGFGGDVEGVVDAQSNLLKSLKSSLDGSMKADLLAAANKAKDDVIKETRAGMTDALTQAVMTLHTASARQAAVSATIEKTFRDKTSPSQTDLDAAIDKPLKTFPKDALERTLTAFVERAGGMPETAKVTTIAGMVETAVNAALGKFDGGTISNIKAKVGATGLTADGVLKNVADERAKLTGADPNAMRSAVVQGLSAVSTLDADIWAMMEPVGRQRIEAALLETVTEDLKPFDAGAVPNSTLLTLRNAMNEKLREATETSTSAPFGVAPARGSQDQPISCSGNLTKRRGFQILGPEGWRTFNPDERLILAMYKSSEPLTNALSEVSQRVLDAYESSHMDLLPLVRTRSEISDLLHELDVQEGEADTLEEAKAVVKSITTQLTTGGAE